MIVWSERLGLKTGKTEDIDAMPSESACSTPFLCGMQRAKMPPIVALVFLRRKSQLNRLEAT